MFQALREKSKKARESDEDSIDDDLPDSDELSKDLPLNRGRGSGARGRPRGRGKRGNAIAGLLNVSVRWNRLAQELVFPEGQDRRQRVRLRLRESISKTSWQLADWLG